MEGPLKRKVTSKLSHQPSTSRPSSPVKTLSHSPSISTLRPKAKVNTSATPRAAPKPKSVISVRSSPAPSVSSSIPRPASPSKFQRPTPSPQPGQPRIRAARSNLSPKISHSVPTTPIVSSPLDPSPNRPRYGSIIGSPQMSDREGPFSSELSSNESSLLNDNQPDPPPPPIMRIKSKVSTVAKAGLTESLSPPLGPSFPSSKPGTPRVRAPSITSSLSLGSHNSTKPHNAVPPSPPKSDINFYPITTASPAANPHRFATTRASPPPPSHHHYQPFSSPSARDDSHVTYTNNVGRVKHRPSISSKVDPAFVPLPPHSPPNSAVSFSSRSSVSAGRSSVSADTKGSILSHNTQHGSKDFTSTLDALVQINGFEETANGNALGITHHDEHESEEKKERNEAKSNRKIEDLEITNRSLLAINSMLESTRNRQAKEIRELRRKLRESRLILPPRTYRMVASEDKDEVEADDETDEDEENEIEQLDKSDDHAFMRVRMLIDGLVESGKQALASKPEDFMTVGKGGAKVLTEDEVKSWRDSSGGDGPDRRQPSPSRIAIPDDDDDDMDSEDEVSAIILPHSNSNSPSPPPILVTRPA
ncbi:hypothetical protein V5O48_000958 [Marasmius crinis-equi]|uniref:Uncharacterized protein n=1 Tax=Marasmius crinis-equi TaxID=585013 RepID=A0ABR3FZR5_9AGAR